jgi:hypothetical protein
MLDRRNVQNVVPETVLAKARKENFAGNYYVWQIRWNTLEICPCG